MTGRYAPRIDFGEGVPWLGMNATTLGLLASEMHAAPKVMALWFAALARMDADGHCPFGKGEVAQLLGNVDTATGELRPMTPANATLTVRRLTALGVACEDSSVRCIRIPQGLAQNARGGSKPCIPHRRKAA